MDSTSNQFKPASTGFKRASFVSDNNDFDNTSFVKPTKKFGFNPASSLPQNGTNEDEDQAILKDYKLDEKVLTSHWLFSDESPRKLDIPRFNYAHFKPSSIATTRVPSIEEPTGFRFASGKRCSNFKFDKTKELRKFLGLDDLDRDVGERLFKSPTISRFETAQSLRFTAPTRQTTSNLYDDYFDTNSVSETLPELPSVWPRKFSYVETWNEVCTYTKYHTSNMSVDVLSELWETYGNPFKVTFDNVEDYKYLLYTHENEFVSQGGLNEINTCFKRAVSDLNLKIRRELFDDAWVRDKFKILTLNSCRRYTQKIIKLLQNESLKDAIVNVPLPNPINLVRKMVKLVQGESSGEDSTLHKIFQGESTPDVPVVVRVESYDGTNLYISDGLDVYKAILADNQIKLMFESNKIRVGSKILIQGIIYKEVMGEFMILLSFNSVSLSGRRPMGLQPKHSNVNIKDLVVGGGRVSRVEVVVLRNFPLVYKIWYKCPETSEKMTLSLSENEYYEMAQDPESEFIATIERVIMQFTMFVVDAVVMNKVNEENFERLLARSCVHITLQNVDDTISYILKPLTRFVLTNTYISFLTNSDYFFHGESDWSPVRLSSTNYSKLEVLEEKVKVSDSLTNNSQLSSFLFNRIPSLSFTEEFDDPDVFLKLTTEPETENLFLGQVCDINGVVLHVGELNSSLRGCHLRFFMLTSKLNLVSVKVDYKNSLEQNDKLSISSEIRSFEKKLKSVVLTLSREDKGPEDQKSSMFYSLQNLQYAGYDDHNEVYNFQVNSDQMILRTSTVLKSVQDCFNDSGLLLKRKNMLLSLSAFETLNDTHLENICKIFFNTIKNTLIKVYKLVQMDSEFVSDHN